MSGKKGLMEQDLGKMDVTKLNPLSPEVISRQATINIGTIGNVAHGKSNKAISGVQVMTPFLGIPWMISSKDEVKVAYIADGLQLEDIGARTILYDQALLFPAFKNQMNEGKGSLENPITMISSIPPGFFARVVDLWTTYTKLKDEKSTPLDLDTVIHNATKDKTIADLKSEIAILEELEHPIVEAMKQDLKLHEKNIILERRSSGASASTSRGEGASSSRASRRH